MVKCHFSRTIGLVSVLTQVIGRFVFFRQVISKASFCDIWRVTHMAPVFVASVKAWVDDQVVLACKLLPTNGALEAYGDRVVLIGDREMARLLFWPQRYPTAAWKKHWEYNVCVCVCVCVYVCLCMRACVCVQVWRGSSLCPMWYWHGMSYVRTHTRASRNRMF